MTATVDDMRARAESWVERAIPKVQETSDIALWLVANGESLHLVEQHAPDARARIQVVINERWAREP